MGRCVHGMLLFILVFCVLLILIFSVIQTRDLPLPPRTKYGMVFDAGSSHTSLFVYQWPADKENNTGIVSQALVCDVQGPGISSYADDPPRAGKSLIRCLEKATGYLSKENQKETPVFLGATAGMRLLREQNNNASDRVLEEVSKAIRSYSLNFRGAEIITGEQEGSYGWITINYLLRSFVKYSFAGHWLRPLNAKIYGALDLGGASTQISFIPKEAIEDPEEKAEFHLYGFPYSLYTHSYLCYGLIEALNKILVKAITNQDVEKPVNVPCYPRGYTNTVFVKSLYNSTCISTTPPSSEQVTLQGTGDATQCRTLIRSIFNFSACANRTDCSFDGVYQPPITGNFYAFSAFYYTFSFLNLSSGQPLSDVNATIQSFCARNWSELKSSYPNENSDHLQNYCISSNYILTLLLDVFRFSAGTWNSITFRKQVDDTDVGWTLGYMLNLTNMIPSESAVTVIAHSYALWMTTILFVVLTLSLSLLLIFTNRKSSHHLYEEI